jgi:uncharacterized protein (DUF1697 family)
LPEDSISQLNLNFIKPDVLALDSTKIYIKYDVSPAKTKLDNNWIEKKLGVTSTIRNWNTVTQLLQLFNTNFALGNKP